MIFAASSSPADVQTAVLGVTGLGVAFALKHFVADFLLQTTWMARGKERRDGWFAPLLCHVLCHTGLTLVIVLAVAPRLWCLALVDFAIHFTVDRAKTLAARRMGCQIDRPQFWWLLGLDQLLHQLTNLGLALTLMVL